MDLIVWSFAGLVGLVALSYYTGQVLHIYSDRFYSYFHLTAGLLAAFLFYGITKSFIVAIVLTEALGIAWEIYEWNMWKYVIKKKRFQPQPADTKNDLVVDFVGSLFGVIAMALWMGR